MSENNEELEYLPLCVLAATLHRHDKHTRKIYTNFCRCTKELQCEILRQAEIDFILPDDNSWIDEGIDKRIKESDVKETLLKAQLKILKNNLESIINL